MASDARRAAADARRIAPVGSDKDAIKKVRDALKDNYERGVAAGRDVLADELRAADPRTTMLHFVAEMCDGAAARTSSIPNSNKALSAYREAAAILRDAAKGEEPVDTKPEAKSTAKRKGK